jgi:hypothetical protein
MPRHLLTSLAISGALCLCAACGADTIEALGDPQSGDLPDAGDPDVMDQGAHNAARDAGDLAEPPSDLPDASAPDAVEADASEPDAYEVDAADLPADPEDVAPDQDAGQEDLGDMGAPEGHRALYPSDRTQSPITPSVAAHLRQVAARGPGWNDHVFAKVGDSITVSRSFLHCFAGDAVALDEHQGLRATLEHFEGGYADGTTPFDRESLAATVGWSAVSALAGDPSPLARELDAIEPRFAVIMYGTNDIERRDIDQYAANLLDMADLLTERGVIPIFSTIMPRDDNAASDALVPGYNAVVRAVSQGRQIPMIDLHREALTLPDHGLGRDNLHPSTYSQGGACALTPEGLQHGYNTRNLLTLQALDRARRAVIEQEAAPDAPGPRLQGAGTPQDPFLIQNLPFVDLRDTREAPSQALDTYTGCQASQDESGPEWIYRLDLDRPATLRAHVFDRGQVDIDLHLMRNQPTEAACVHRAHQEIEAQLSPGTWFLALDTWVNGGGQALGGEYMLTVLLEEP